MRAFITVVVLIVCCLLQALAAKYIVFCHIRLEFVLIAVVFYSLRMDLLPAALVGVAGGLLKDSLSSAPYGSSAMALFILAVTLSWNRRYLSAGSAVTQILLVVSSILLYGLLSGLVKLLFGAGFPAFLTLKYAVPILVANALVAPPCFKIIGFVDHEMA